MDAPSEMPQDQTQSAQPARRWQPINGTDRRVLGVLAEKAKTTPDVYPMSLNGICTGANQKSNRSPIMQLEPDQVEESLDRLRELGAVALVEGYGRVQKYRHYLYEWLGVDKIEIAVMTELLLRGEQTIGELRGRASRMEPIADLAALKKLLDGLKAKGLVVFLTPEGRGQVVTHALYKPREMEQIQAKYAGGWRPAAEESAAESSDESAEEPSNGASRPTTASTPVSVHAAVPASAAVGGALEAMRQEIASLRQQVAESQHEIEEVRNTQSRLEDELRQLKDALGG